MVVGAHVLAFSALAASALLFFKVRSAAGIVLWFPKALAGSAAAFLVLVGGLGSFLGVITRAPLAVAAGALGAILSARYVWRVAAHHDGFERAFGRDWPKSIPAEQKEHMLRRRWVGRLRTSGGVHWSRDVSFWTIPGTDRDLLCDLWQPPLGKNPSGLAFIYLHGGAWHWMDKDFGTRPLFCRLADQGHVVMDVAYRLCPEVDIRGMVGDAKRAISWIKDNSSRFGVDPEQVVLAGGSSGGHIALLAAYAPDHPDLTPADVRDADLRVRAAVAYYSATDMRAFYGHFDSLFGGLMRQQQSGNSNPAFRAIGRLTRAVMGSAAVTQTKPPFSIGWMMGNLVGGTPAEVPATYDLASPIFHAGSHCPPTLLLQGEDDPFQPVDLTRALHNRLTAAQVPSVLVVYPQTEHGFDLLLPRYAPAGQAALYEVERFLALMG